MGEMVEFPGGSGSCPGYLAVPASGRGPAVLVIQEWWGLVDHVKRVCDRLAGDGLVALAPDLYHGESTKEPDEAVKLMMAMRLEGAVADMKGAVDYLLGHDAVEGDGVGVIGFCMGGGLALYLATREPRIRECVPFYGVIPWPDANPDWSAVKARVDGHYAENDGSASRENVGAMEAAMREAGVAVTITWHPGTDHAFFNDDRPEVYNHEESEKAYAAVLPLLRG